MRVLVVGGGGREHAIVWKLAQSPHVDGLWCVPGNPGARSEVLATNGRPVETIDLDMSDLPAIADLAAHIDAELTVIGPDNTLADGIVDLFRARHLRVWGPTRQAAQLESDKWFAAAFMQRHGVPIPRSASFTDGDDAQAFARSLAGRCVVKANGLALGKGVAVCHQQPEADQAIHDMLVAQVHGAAGDHIVIQELVEGTEISLHAICDGRTSRLFPLSQDHKPVFDDNLGPNTGGMGAYTPAPFVDEAGLAELSRLVVEPIVQGCQAEGLDFRGILYPGVMLTADGPRVFELNARFGDPETQVYLPRLDTDLLELLDASMDGSLDATTLRWRADHVVTVVLASAGYPATADKGRPIHGVEEADRLPNVKIFHSGTAEREGALVTNGGRVLSVTAWAPTLLEAQHAAYDAAQAIHLDGCHYRSDIGSQALTNRFPVTG